MSELTTSRILLCMLGSRSLYRAPLVSPHEVFAGPHCKTDLSGPIKTIAHPAGDVDLADLLHRLRPHWTPEVVLVKADATGANFVRNLESFDGPRILMVGDTHHLKQPLRRIIRYARSEPFDAYMVTHTPHHREWFARAGLAPLWITPGIEANHYPQPEQDLVAPIIAFVGNLSPHHPYRSRIIATMERAGLPLKVEKLEPAHAAQRYAGSALSLNVSLNGDLNLRVWEVLSAGGLLLTDQLAPESGLGEWLKAGTHYLAYDSPEEAVALARHYLAHPEEATVIRQAGHRRYLQVHDPATMWREVGALLTTVERRSRPVAVDMLPSGFMSELSQYEWVQEKHRLFSKVAIEAVGCPPPAMGLPRIVDGRPAPESPWQPWEPPLEAVFPMLWVGDLAALSASTLAQSQAWAIRVPPSENWAGCAEWGFAPSDASVGIYLLEDPCAYLRKCIAVGEAAAAQAKTRSLVTCWPEPKTALGLAHIWSEAGASSMVGEIVESALRAHRGDARFWNAWIEWLRFQQAPEAMVFAAEAARWGLAPEISVETEGDSILQGWRERAGRSRLPTAESPRRILLVTNLFPPQEMGGYGRMMWEFAAGLVARGHTVKVLAANIPDLDRPAESIESQMVPDVMRCLRLYGTWKNGKTTPLTDMEAIKELVLANMHTLRAVVEQWKPDVGILGNLDFIGLAVLEQWLALKVPVIHCVANEGPGYPPENFPATDQYVVAPCSDWNGRIMRKNGYPLRDYTVVFPGARTERFFQLVPPHFGRLNICYASLVMPFKGAHVLINALTLLHRWGIPFECEIAGDSTDPAFLDKLRNKTVGCGYAAQVKFTGFLDRDGLARLFMRSNVLVFPSVFEEPFGISQVEAMAAGLVVVSSGTGGASEIVEDGINGVKFESENATDLAHKLAHLATHPERAQSLGQAAQERAEVFNVKHSVGRLEMMVERALASTDPDGEFQKNISETRSVFDHNN